MSLSKDSAVTLCLEGWREVLQGCEQVNEFYGEEHLVVHASSSEEIDGRHSLRRIHDIP
jgi:hypothetical protein